jgi:hypothetical protein
VSDLIQNPLIVELFESFSGFFSY